MVFDSHAHITSDEMYVDVQNILARSKDAHVDKIMCICTDKITTERALELKQEYVEIGLAGATTPHDVEKEGELYFPYFEDLARRGVFKAIGETGLDYFYEHSPKELQQEFFIRYLKLAKELHLPVVIHCRDAFTDLFVLADKYYPKGKFVLHCFTGTLEDAKECLKRNWMISCSGIITFKKSEDLRNVIKQVPLTHLFIETDSPYLAPGKFRGKRNEPSYVIETAEVIASIKEVPLSEVLNHTTNNAKVFFNM